jgi:monoamine oxidase
MSKKSIVLSLLFAGTAAVVATAATDRRDFKDLAARTAIADESAKPGSRCPLSKAYLDTLDLDVLSLCLAYGWPAIDAAQRYPALAPKVFTLYGEDPTFRSVFDRYGHLVLSLLPIQGTQWTAEDGKLSRDETPYPHEAELHRALQQLKDDVTVAEFLRRYFAGPKYGRLRHYIERMVEGYDAADPERASTLALRDEWMDGGRSTQVRIAGGYGALIDFLTAECRNHGVAIQLGSAVSAIEASNTRATVRCANGDAHEGNAVVLTVPLPLLKEIVLPPAERERAALAAHIGFGNVIKILLRFETRWWVDKRTDLANLTFLLSDKRIPVWWTQHPAEHPVLTGWFGGPKTERMARLNEQELIEAGFGSLADIFGLDPTELMRTLVAARAINWARDPFAGGAYSYATPERRAAQEVLSRIDGGPVFLSGEALYRGRDTGTVEAALGCGLETRGPFSDKVLPPAGTPDRCRRSHSVRRERPRPPVRERRRTADLDGRREGRGRGHGDRCGPSSSRAHRIRGWRRPRAEPTWPIPRSSGRRADAPS